jgi:hypothetical protein
MNERDPKRFLNEILPEPETAGEVAGSEPRQRTQNHLKRILSLGLALPLAANVSSCGYLVVDPVPPPQVQPGQPPGFLSLKSTPAADIEIDGKPTGIKTPQDRIELSPGIHTIRLATNNLQQSFTVEIKSGSTLSVNRELASPPSRDSR